MSNTIKEVYVNKRKDGGTWWAVILDDGERYSVFDTAIGEKFAVGQTYDFGVVTNGKFKNIVKADLVEDVNKDIKDVSFPEFVTDGQQEPEFVANTGIALATSPENAIESIPPASKTEMKSPGNPINKDEAIARSVALKSAVEAFKAVGGSDDTDGFVIDLAKRYFTYLTTGK